MVKHGRSKTLVFSSYSHGFNHGNTSLSQGIPTVSGSPLSSRHSLCNSKSSHTSSTISQKERQAQAEVRISKIKKNKDVSLEESDSQVYFCLSVVKYFCIRVTLMKILL
jgi:hypothetical protein